MCCDEQEVGLIHLLKYWTVLPWCIFPCDATFYFYYVLEAVVVVDNIYFQQTLVTSDSADWITNIKKT